MFVLTVDQRGSRRRPDRVADVLDALARAYRPLRAFERTAGDEFQGLLDDPVQVVDVVLALVRAGGWSIGVGTGEIETPLPAGVREGRGPAFIFARNAVEAAKRRPPGLVIRGPRTTEVEDAEALLVMLALVVQRRSPAAWEAVDLVAAGLPAAEVARRLRISRQAVSQRLTAGHWQQERLARPAAARLLARAAA